MEQHLPQRPNMSASNRYQYLFYCDVHIRVSVHSPVWPHVRSYMLIVFGDDGEREGLGRNCEKRDAGGTGRKQIWWGGWGDWTVTEELKILKKGSCCCKDTTSECVWQPVPEGWCSAVEWLCMECFLFVFSLNPKMVSLHWLKRSGENKVDCVGKQVPVDIVAHFHSLNVTER